MANQTGGQPGRPEAPVRRLTVGSVEWKATEAGEALLRACWPDWARAMADGSAEPVKANPLRAVYRLGGDGEGAAEYYVKRYEEASLLARLKRLIRGPAAVVEWRHARHAASVGLPVPPPLACGVAPNASFLITASCQPAEDLDDHLAAAGWSDAVAAALADLVAAVHAAGVIHRDLHAGNVLIRPGEPAGPRVAQPPPAVAVAGGSSDALTPEGGHATGTRLWLLDLHKARRVSHVTAAGRIRNLAMLVAGLRRWAGREQLDEFLRGYLESLARRSGGLTGCDRPEAFIARVHRQADRHAARLLGSRDRAILRTGRYFARVRLAGGWRGHVYLQNRRLRLDPQSSAGKRVFTVAEWEAALADPAGLVHGELAEGERVFKESGSSRVVRRSLLVGSQRLDVFVKHYPWRVRLAALIDPFRPSRATRAFKLGHQLLARGVPTAMPLACLERRVGRFLVESIVITEALADTLHLEHFALGPLNGLPPSANARARQGLARQLGQALARIRRAGWVHRDLKAPNVLIRCDATGQAELFLVDLDGLRRGWLDPLRPLVRLNAGLSAVPGLTRTDRMRVLVNYLGPAGNVKAAWRAIERASSARLARRG